MPLRRSGRTYTGLCPFHSEKTPSFHVDPERRTFHCFGCGRHGDCFTWLEEQEGLTPAEALRTLAERAGVELTRRAPEERETEKRLLAAHETAHFYFRQALRGTVAGKAAAEYLAGRGIQPETVDRFGLGYAPDARDGLLGYLRKKGFSDEEAVASGLAIPHERGLFDRFRDRLMIPIRDGRGRVIAFAGRAMREGQPAKYMNSPATELFDKSRTLYALDVAKGHIRRKSEAVIVEGQFDAISCHQAGLDNAVASMGTALTEAQYLILSGLKIERAVVAFDGDAAGSASAEKRGRELAAVIQRAVRTDRAGRGAVTASTATPVFVAVLPPGTDPDELARSDPARLRATLADAQPVLAFVIGQIQKRTDLASPEGRRRFLADTLPLLGGEPDALTRELYLGTLSRLTGLPEESLRSELAAAGRGRTAPAAAPQRGTAAVGADRPVPQDVGGDRERIRPSERYLMAQLVQFPEEAARLDLDAAFLTDPDHRAIYELLRSGERPGPGSPAHLAAKIAALGAMAPAPADQEQARRAIGMAALRVREENLRRRLGEIRAALARGNGDVGGLQDELALVMDDLALVMRAKERDTVHDRESEDE